MKLITTVKNWKDNFKLISTDTLLEIKKSLILLNNDNKEFPICNGHNMFRKEYPELKSYIALVNNELDGREMVYFKDVFGK